MKVFFKNTILKFLTESYDFFKGAVDGNATTASTSSASYNKVAISGLNGQMLDADASILSEIIPVEEGETYRYTGSLYTTGNPVAAVVGYSSRTATNSTTGRVVIVGFASKESSYTLPSDASGAHDADSYDNVEFTIPTGYGIVAIRACSSKSANHNIYKVE